MSQILINIGQAANDGTGDSLRAAFSNVNLNFSELYSAISGMDGNLSNATSTGTFTVSGTLNSSGKAYFRANGFHIIDYVDNSKQVRFDLSDHYNGSTTVLRLPTSSGSLISELSQSTLVNKTLDGLQNTFTNVSLGSTIGTLSPAQGGTGYSRNPGIGEILIGTGTGFNLAQLTPGAGISIDNTPGGISISASQQLDVNAIQTIVSDMFSDNESEGISESYDSTNKKINLYAKDFFITLDGDVSGHATVSALSDVVIQTTSTNLLKGITTSRNGYPSGSDQSVKRLNFTGPVELIQEGDMVTVAVSTQLTDQGVRDIIGSTVTNTVTDETTGFPTDSGIVLNYEPSNQTLQLGAREFDVQLVGDVTGTGTIKRLNDVIIQTTTSAIKGLSLKKDDLLIGYNNSIKTLNFIGAGDITVDQNGQANVFVSAITSAEQIAPMVGGMLTGRQNGVAATYNSNNRNIDFALKPIQINLNGSVVGSGNINFTGSESDGIVTINTVGGTGGAGGVTIADEYNVTGTVNEINFVGGGVTTAVSIDGSTATVYVPNSPAAENFILATSGSDNVQNARKFTAGAGIAITDEGPGGRFIVSAESDALLAKTQFYVGNVAVGQQIGLDVQGSQDIVLEATEDETNSVVRYTVYSLEDGWFRKPRYDCGETTDKYGSTLELGDFTNKIISYAADLGTL